MLEEKAVNKDIIVLPGFEVSSSEGVHILCIFDKDEEVSVLERYLGDLGIYTADPSTKNSRESFRNILYKVQKEWNGICIAAHITNDGGLLKMLKGEARINAWKDPNLLAVQIPGSVDGLEYADRKIVLNKDMNYKRERKIAVINASDVGKPSDLALMQSSTFIKMSIPSVEGLRQAFLDPDSRIRLLTEGIPPEHTEIIALHWEGGFLDKQSIHFNSNLNVLIGGRGTGKSTIIESIRYVLDLEPIGEEAKRNFSGILKEVIKSGTKISLLIHSHYPFSKYYLIERIYPNPPVVKDMEGNVLDLLPGDILKNVEIYGQHEIGELTRYPARLSKLLKRFTEEDPHLIDRKREILKKLDKNRKKIIGLQEEIEYISSKVQRLPALKETFERFKNAGLEDRLKEQSYIVKEEQIIRIAFERLKQLKDVFDNIKDETPIDKTFLSEKSLEPLPAKEILKKIRNILVKLENNLEKIVGELDNVLKDAESEINAVRQEWEKRREQVQKEYEKTLRELQKESIDGEEFINLQKQIERLNPLKEKLKQLKKERELLSKERQHLLTDWEDIKATEFRKIENAAKKASMKLINQIRITVSFCGDREPLFKILREKIGGRLIEAINTLKEIDEFSLTEFINTCRKGAGEIQKKYKITPEQSRRLAGASDEIYMEIEELDLPHTTNIELNIGSADQQVWKRMEELSTGQKATAILLLLLLESDAPLIIDQPEDDLDNFFIAEGIVPRMREAKLRRQFIFSTHNANIPVLGDAEHIIGLRAVGEAAGGYGEIPSDWMGSIDNLQVRLNVETILEGGKEAFETRRAKYGF